VILLPDKREYDQAATNILGAKKLGDVKSADLALIRKYDHPSPLGSDPLATKTKQAREHYDKLK
jgi:hypothetical protein